jgi:hypothetical protein
MKSTMIMASLVLAAAAGAAQAGGSIWAQDSSGIYNGTNPTGGAFVMNRINGYVGERLGEQGLTSSQFHTFCIEVGEHIRLGGSQGQNNNVYYAEIATSAKNGGAGFANPSGPGTEPGTSTSSEDFLSYTTAKIYSEFRNNGTFGNFTAAQVNTSTFTSSIQQAIWYSEGEVALGSISADALTIFNWASANHGGTLGNVRVLRLWETFTNGEYGGNSQDQLTLIPLPTGAALGLAGLSVLAIRRRAAR